MKLPHDVIIPREKLTQYLLVSRRRNDKSGFLAQAGFILENWQLLEEAIRDLVAENEALQDRQNEYGAFYTVTGELRGSEGSLSTITVWIHQTSGGYRFITLKPARTR